MPHEDEELEEKEIHEEEEEKISEGNEADEEEEGEEEGASQGDDEEEDDEGETIILIGDEEPEDDDSGSAPPWVKDLRRQNREQAKRIKELEAKTASAKTEEELGKKPTIEDFEFDEDKHAEAVEQWVEKKKRIQRSAEEKRQKEQVDQERYNKKLSGYNERKSSLGVKNFEALEATVVDGLSEMQQGMIVSAAKKPEEVICALGQHPKKLAEMASIEDPVEFIAETVRLELAMRTTTRKKPAPEKKPPSGKGGFRGGHDKRLEELEAEAARTGDRTKVIKLPPRS